MTPKRMAIALAFSVFLNAGLLASLAWRSIDAKKTVSQKSPKYMMIIQDIGLSDTSYKKAEAILHEGARRKRAIRLKKIENTLTTVRRLKEDPLLDDNELQKLILSGVPLDEKGYKANLQLTRELKQALSEKELAAIYTKVESLVTKKRAYLLNRIGSNF
ncbi:MAG: hypothetical protein MI742_17865 [Desulfobacterales bacterium]|nr:hypothetical protein [Desulfobacterales bacterium]